MAAFENNWPVVDNLYRLTLVAVAARSWIEVDNIDLEGIVKVMERFEDNLGKERLVAVGSSIEKCFEGNLDIGHFEVN